VEDGELVVLSLEGPLGLLGDVLGDVLGEVLGDVEGDADGERSPGRSPTRSVRDSVQPAMTPAPRTSTQIPVSNLFIGSPFVGPSADERRRRQEGATQMPPAVRLTGSVAFSIVASLRPFRPREDCE
jgi:hypothetical protein